MPQHISVLEHFDLRQLERRAWFPYHRAEYLPERRRMMPKWADYLDEAQEKWSERA